MNPYTYGKNLGAADSKSYYEIATDTEIASKCAKVGDDKVALGKREMARNELIGAALRLSDTAVSEHLAATKSTETNVNLALGAATSGLAGGATVAGAEAGAKMLSAAATGTNAARSLFNETTYRNALGETLIGAIESDRKTQRDGIINKMKAECIDSYSVEMALGEVQQYLEAGSFYHGLALIRQAAEQANAQRQGKIAGDSKEIVVIKDYFYEEMKNKVEEIKSKTKTLQEQNKPK